MHTQRLGGQLFVDKEVLARELCEQRRDRARVLCFCGGRGVVRGRAHTLGRARAGDEAACRQHLLCGAVDPGPDRSLCCELLRLELPLQLIERAADVALKERRQLILVPREAPYSEIHLEHMLKLTRMGVVIIPASPGFYNRPTTIEDMVDFVVARILNQLNIEQNLLPKWGEDLI